MRQIGVNLWDKAVNSGNGVGTGSSGAAAGVALEADFSDLNTNETWIFW